MIPNLSITKRFLFLSFLWSAPSYSEIRVYLLKVLVPQPLGAPIEYQVVSSLDRRQYQSFLGGRRGQVKATALKSWTCPGHTGNFKDLCPDAEGKTYPRGPFQP